VTIGITSFRRKMPGGKARVELVRQSSTIPHLQEIRGAESQAGNPDGIADVLQRSLAAKKPSHSPQVISVDANGGG
jgi:hypothetical protein